MSEHYFELNDAKDKAIHLLYAGFVCGYFDESKDVCMKEFGDKITAKAIQEFNDTYKNSCTVID